MSRKIIILVLVMLLFSSFPAAGEVYVVFTDREFGFWGVRSYNTNHTFNYTSKVLNINTGDSIEWMNMDYEGERITIVSDDTLWEGGKVLSDTGKRFRFRFNSSGLYRFHIIENTRTNLNASNQSENFPSITTLTYVDEDGETHMITVTQNQAENFNDVVNTERYTYQQQMIRVSGPTIGNGTHPIRRTQQVSSSYTTGVLPAIQVNARPTSKVPESLAQAMPESLTQAVVAKAAPKPMESYQEFTIYAVLKRWFDIIISGG
ncbi:Uncharacterised protein [uncultured archaeon]|nr:Uncharacterised protein [uncultured archaeon]